MTIEAGAVYRQLAPAVLGYLRGQGAPDPEDLLSEVFLQVARSLPRYRGEEEDLRRWIFTIARNRLIDARRRQRRRLPVSPAASPDLPAPAAADPMDEELLQALAELTPEQREVVVLRFVADLPLQEVASLTGRSEGAVKSMQHRGLDQLARILGGPPSAEPGNG